MGAWWRQPRERAPSHHHHTAHSRERMAHTRGQVIAIANTKDGVGKSTLGGNLTWALTMQTYRRVLPVDVDPQA
jgi:Mrp family chromosome partitioning ATPase